MKVYIFILMGIILSFLESSLLSYIPAEFLKPDVTIPMIVYTTFFLNTGAGLIVSVIMGVIQEILSASPDGSMIFLKVLIFLLTLFFKNKLFIDSKYSFSYVCAGAVVCESLIYAFLSWIAKGESRHIENILFFMLPNAVFTGFLAIFIFSFVGFLNMKFFSKD
ncbi:MAG: rod shape-determining protein MreD [Syntrophorhabdaceae bacterium]|nr:rod shape-determining protein MreD [Syntrophorhabdaceae bacterium]